MGFGAPPGGGNYPIDENYEYNIQNMTPEMEAKFLWLMDQAAGIAQPEWGALPAQDVAGFTDPQKEAFKKAQAGIGAWSPFMDKAGGYADKFATGEFDPESYKQYLDPYQEHVTQGISEQYDKAINEANI